MHAAPDGLGSQHGRMGKVLRTFKFRVGADGLIAPHPEQVAADGLRLPKHHVVIDVVMPNPVPDAYFDPAAVRASGFYGRPWSDKAAHADQPPAKGALELAAPKGAR